MGRSGSSCSAPGPAGGEVLFGGCGQAGEWVEGGSGRRWREKTESGQMLWGLALRAQEFGFYFNWMGSHWRVLNRECYRLELESDYFSQKRRKQILGTAGDWTETTQLKSSRNSRLGLRGPAVFKHHVLPPASFPVCRSVSPLGWPLRAGSPEALLTCLPGGAWGPRNRVIQALVAVGFEWLRLFYQACLSLRICLDSLKYLSRNVSVFYRSSVVPPWLPVSHYPVTASRSSSHGLWFSLQIRPWTFSPFLFAEIIPQPITWSHNKSPSPSLMLLGRGGLLALSAVLSQVGLRSPGASQPAPMDRYLLTVRTSSGSHLPNTASSELSTLLFRTQPHLYEPWSHMLLATSLSLAFSLLLSCARLWIQNSVTGPALDLCVVQESPGQGARRPGFSFQLAVRPWVNLSGHTSIRPKDGPRQFSNCSLGPQASLCRSNLNFIKRWSS